MPASLCCGTLISPAAFEEGIQHCEPVKVNLGSTFYLCGLMHKETEDIFSAHKDLRGEAKCKYPSKVICSSDGKSDGLQVLLIRACPHHRLRESESLDPANCVSSLRSTDLWESK